MSFIWKNKIILVLSIYTIVLLNNVNSSTIQLLQPNTIANTTQIGYPQPLQNGTQLGIINTQSGLYQNNLAQSNIYGSTYGINNITYGTQVTPYSANSIQYSVNNTVPYGNTQYNQVNNTNSKKFYSKAKNKYCQNEYIQSNGSYMLDLSDTCDINTVGNDIIKKFIQNAVEKKYDFVYIDLCNTDVQTLLIAQWNQLLKQNNIQVIWNISNNSTVNDDTLAYLESLDNIKGLNISNTNISPNGILQILCKLLNNNVDSTIQFINICGLNITPEIKSYLINAFNNHIALWKQKNNNKEYIFFKNAIIDNYDDNLTQNISQYNTNGLQQQSVISQQIQQPLLQSQQLYNYQQQFSPTLYQATQPVYNTTLQPQQFQNATPTQLQNSVYKSDMISGLNQSLAHPAYYNIIR